MRKAPSESPAKTVNLSQVKDQYIAQRFRDIIRLLQLTHRELANALNFNTIDYVSQNAAPVPEEGKFMIWRDADAAAGQPKAYLVATVGGETFTFASVEVV